MVMVITPVDTKPGSTRRSAHRLRIIRPAPTSRMSDSATSAITRMLRVPFPLESLSVLPRPFFKASFRSTLVSRHPATKPAPPTVDYVIVAGAAGLRWEDLDPIKTPTLLIGGADTTGSLATNWRVMAEHIVGAQTAVIPDGRHWMFENNPQAFCRPVTEFLAA